MQFLNAQYSTITGNLRINNGSGQPVIEIDPNGNNHWVTIDYSKLSNFKAINAICGDTLKGGNLLLRLSAHDVVITSGALSAQTTESIIPNRRFTIATEATLIRMQ
jgi:hypothetical protein